MFTDSVNWKMAKSWPWSFTTLWWKTLDRKLRARMRSWLASRANLPNELPARRSEWADVRPWAPSFAFCRSYGSQELSSSETAFARRREHSMSAFTCEALLQVTSCTEIIYMSLLVLLGKCLHLFLLPSPALVYLLSNLMYVASWISSNTFPLPFESPQLLQLLPNLL